MTTNLKTFLSPKLISPLSPKCFNTALNRKDNASPFSNKKLNTKKEAVLPKSSLRKNLFNAQIDVTVTDYSKQEIKKDVLLNTPMKRHILKTGLNEEKYLNILGCGGFGKVVSAEYKGDVVALKIVKRNEQLRERNGLHLSHENLVRTISIINSEKDNYSMIIMEYLPNCTQLQKMVEDFDIDMADKLIKFSVDICKGLDYCHRKKILHLDIKPRNILVHGNTCKICDFGNSACERDLADSYEFNGTTHYAAPEILLGEKPSDKCDVYSIGIVFWQMRRRKSPYSELKSNEEIIYKVVKYSYRPDMAPAQDVYCELYQDCWKSLPRDRPSTTEILEKLHKLF